MGVAITIEKFLNANHIQFSLHPHAYAEGSFNTAKVACIDTHCLAKGVLLRDEDFHYTLCVLPSSHKILRHTLNQIFDRHMHLVEEDELMQFFKDCDAGAVPPLGKAYGIDVIWDEELINNDAIYMEAGDHRHLIRIEQTEFPKLMKDTLHDHFSSDRAKHYQKPVHVRHSYDSFDNT
ncbi:MAG: YbaK/EbsC family protein [Pseudomonadota bacterium]